MSMLAQIERIIPWLSSVLFMLFAIALWWSRSPRSWCAQERRALLAQSEEPEEGIKPTPIRDRAQMLSHAKDTALLEGDVGAFILRRDRVSDANIAGFMATVLVTLSIFFTVVGMSCTVANVADAIQVSPEISSGIRDATPSPTVEPSASPSTTDSKRVATALGAMPTLFIPTAVGLILSVILLGVQSRTDSHLDSVWREIDAYTEKSLIPRFVRPRSDPWLKIESAATALDASSGQLNSISPIIQATMAQLQQLDQSKWAADLITAAEVFQSKAEHAGALLDAAATRVADTFNRIPDVTGQMTALCTSLTSASSEVSASIELNRASYNAVEWAINGVSKTVDALSAHQQDVTASVDRLTNATGKEVQRLNEGVQSLTDEVKTEIESLQGAVHSLSSTVTSFSNQQTDVTRQISRTVDNLELAATKLPDSIRSLVEQGQRNGDKLLTDLTDSTTATKEAVKQMQGYVTVLQQQLEQVKGELRRVLHEAHEALLTNVLNRLDQGHDLHAHLQSVATALGTVNSGLARMGANMSDVLTVVEPARRDLLQHQSALAETSRSSHELQSALQATERAFQSQAQQVAAGLGAWQESLSTLHGMVAKLDASLDGLQRDRQTAVDPSTAMREAVEPLTAAVKALTSEMKRTRPKPGPWWWPFSRSTPSTDDEVAATTHGTRGE